MKPYSAYKDSGLDWLGIIPAHWSARRVKYLFREIQEKSTSGEEDLLSVSQYTGITLFPKDEVMRAKTLEGYKTVKKGDLVINIMLAWLGALAVSDFNGVASPAYCVYRANPEHNPKYFEHLFKTGSYLAEFARQSRGIVESRWRMYTDDFYRITAIIPPREEQDKIVDFLDAKLADIDRYIAEKERLIELLQEQKTALINQAVTRGLNPLARMKSSGMEWLGEIPEHWEVKRNKLIFREIIDRSATGNETRLSMSQKYGLVASDTLEAKTLQSESSEGFKVCQVNDLVLNRLKAHLGVFSRSTIPGSVSPDYTVLRLTTKADVRYFEYLFRHPAYIGWFNKVVRGIIAGFWRLYTQDFLNIMSIFPPPEEQKQIVEYIITETNKIKQSIETLEKEISLMQEYRTALIAEAVTGKVDVRAVHE